MPQAKLIQAVPHQNICGTTRQTCHQFDVQLLSLTSHWTLRWALPTAQRIQIMYLPWMQQPCGTEYFAFLVRNISLKTIELTSRSTLDTTVVAPQYDNKYLVFESKLKELFEICTTCLKHCTASFTCVGSFLRVESRCADGHVFSWESQPYIGNKPAGNVLLSAAILFSGANPIPTLRMLELINVMVSH